MAMILKQSEMLKERMAFYQTRRIEAHIAEYKHFGDGDLSQYLKSDSIATVAGRLAKKYFYKSSDFAIYDMVRDIYVVSLVVAPILQLLPLSFKFDWHRGHLVSMFRVECNNRRKRFHVGIRAVERTYQPDLLMANLNSSGINDVYMVETILDLYRRHSGATALKDLLAHQIFDPFLMKNQKIGFELRHSNFFYRFEKEPFEGSVDIRKEPVTALDYCMISQQHNKGRHLEIMIADATLVQFRRSVKLILSSSAAPKVKLEQIKVKICDLVERVRPARTAMSQLLDLKAWLKTKVAPLAASTKDANLLPQILINMWLQRSDSRLYLKAPSFFFNPSQHNEKVFATFFSPYREV